jgi:type IV secretion system protein VirD4
VSTSQQSGYGSRPIHEDWLAWAIGGGFGLGIVGWLGAELAALVFGGHHALPFDAFAPLAAAAHWRDPALAWPASARIDLPGPLAYWGATGFVLIVVLVLVVALAARFVGEGGRRGLDTDSAAKREVLRTMGAAATMRAARRLRPGGLERPASFVRPEGVLLGRIGGKDVFAGWEDSLLVVGPPRSGKSSSLVVPATVEAPGAVLVTSTRPDVLKAAARLRSQVGPVFVFDPDGLAQGSGVPPLPWSPVAGAEDVAVAVRRARAMVGAGGRIGPDGDFWTGAGGDLLARMLLAAAVGGRSAEDLAQWASSPAALSRAAKTLSAAAHARPELARFASDLTATANSAAQATSASMLAVVGRALACLGNPLVTQSVNTPPDQAVDATELLRSRATIFALGTPGGSSPAPLLTALVTDLTEAARQLAAASPVGRLDPPLLVMLDEAANIAPLPDLPQLLAAGGGDGIVAAVILQSLDQARGRWGQQAAGAMLDSATIRLVLPGLSHPGDLRDLAALAGERGFQERSHTRSDQGGSSETIATRDKVVLRADELRTLPAGSAMLVPRRARPVRIELVPHWRRHWG